MQRLLIAAAFVWLVAFGQVYADSTVAGIGTDATSPLPAGSCLYVDQGPGTDAKLCSGYAAALGALVPGGALGTPSSGTLTNAIGLPISTGVSGLGTGVATFLATPNSANLATAVTNETGSGALVFATSPTLVTPNLGTPSAATLTNATGLPLATGISGLGTGVATAAANNVGTAGSLLVAGNTLGLPSAGTLTNTTGFPLANLAGAGTGFLTAAAINVSTVGSVLVQGGVLGTPSSGVLTNATGLPVSTGISGLGSGVATFLATPSSANLASALTNETGSGLAVFNTGPTLIGGTFGDITGSIQCVQVDGSGAWGGSGSPCLVPITVQDGTTTVANTTTLTFSDLFSVTSLGGQEAAVTLTQRFNDQTGGNYAILTGDAGKTVLVSGGSHTLAQAGTTGFEDGYGVCVTNVHASNNSTITTTTSVFLSASGTSVLTLKPQQQACLGSFDGDYTVFGGGYDALSASRTGQVITGGATTTSKDLGVGTGTENVTCSDRGLQRIVNNGAFTLAAPANESACNVLVENDSSAGTITLSGFTAPATVLDNYNTTNNNLFMFAVVCINDSAASLKCALSVTAMQ